MKLMAVMVPLSALLLIAVAVPLALRKVPPNHLYGFRTQKTLSNTAVWYEANAFAGRNMIWAGALTLIAWAALVLLVGLPHSAMPGMAVFTVAVVVALVVSLVQLRAVGPS